MNVIRLVTKPRFTNEVLPNRKLTIDIDKIYMKCMVGGTCLGGLMGAYIGFINGKTAEGIGVGVLGGFIISAGAPIWIPVCMLGGILNIINR